MRLQTKSLRLWCFCNTKVWLEACISCIVHLEMSGAVYISISRWWRRNIRVFFCIFLNKFWLLKLEHLARFSSKIIFVKRSEVHWILSLICCQNVNLLYSFCWLFTGIYFITLKTSFYPFFYMPFTHDEANVNIYQLTTHWLFMVNAGVRWTWLNDDECYDERNDLSKISAVRLTLVI